MAGSGAMTFADFVSWGFVGFITLLLTVIGTILAFILKTLMSLSNGLTRVITKMGHHNEMHKEHKQRFDKHDERLRTLEGEV